MNSSTINSDETINVNLSFVNDEICQQDVDQLNEWIGKGIDSTGLLRELSDKIQLAINNIQTAKKV